MMKKNAKYILSALAVITVFSCNAFQPIAVKADSTAFSTLQDVVSYIIGLQGNEASAMVTSASSGNPYTTALVMSVYMLSDTPGIVTMSNIDANTFFTCSGLYKDSNGVNRICTLCIPDVSNGYNVSDGALPILYSNDFNITMQMSANTNLYTSVVLNRSPCYVQGFPGNALYTNTMTSSGCLQGNQGNSSIAFDLYFYLQPPSTIVPALANTNLNDYLLRVTDSRQTPTFSAYYSDYLPSGSFNPADPYDYIDNTLRPYIEQNYPDSTWLLPTSQEDPTETDTGGCGCHIDYDEILSERELESILNSETYYVPELYTYPTYQLETLPTLESNPLANYASVGGFLASSASDLIIALGLQGLFILIAIVAVIIFYLRGW